MKKIIIFIFLLFVFSGCIKLLLRSAGIINTKISLKKLVYQNKDILFLGMVHISQQPYYDKCKKIIDSLSAQGYYIFGEGIKGMTTGEKEHTILELQQDTIYRKKMRKLLGTDPAYYQKSEFFVKFAEKYELVIQPKTLYPYEKDTTIGKIVDCPRRELIDDYEKEKGQVVLSEYDLKTNIGEEYKTPENFNKKERDYFLDNMGKNKRNFLIANEIKKSSHKKLLLVYGDEHYQGIKELLEGKQK